MKKLFGGILLTAAAAAVLFFGIRFLKNAFSQNDTEIVYMTQSPSQGDLRLTISATGTVEPEELVNVGAQIGGMITEFGRDTDGKPVDYGSKVKAGAVLARIDDSLYAAECDSAKAALLQAEAAIASAQANLKQAQAKLDLAKSNWDRIKVLKHRDIASQSESDTALSDYNAAQAAVNLAEASIKEAEAKQTAAKAALSKAERNLSYCTITSPVDGVIIDRRVNIGQTVNASMNAPSLFLIARDLKRMQVWVSVNEADIGEIRPGGKAEFTVDAFPGRIFSGVIRKTRLNATMSQNVVTYVVEIDTDNSDGTLLPYLTANVKFILQERTNVRRVPNAAFRFTPAGRTAPETKAGERILWVKSGKELSPVIVRTGLNDGSNTEILSGDLPDGAEIVTGSRTVSRREMAEETGAGSGTNPFLPKMPARPGAKKKN